MSAFAVFLLVIEVVGPSLPLLPVPRRQDCSAQGDEITVCAKKKVERSPYRLPRMDEEVPMPAMGKAEIGIGNGKSLSVESEQAGVGGFVSNRGMLRLKVPLGGKR